MHTNTPAIAHHQQEHARMMYHADADTTAHDDGHTPPTVTPWPYVMRWMATLPGRVLPPRLLSMLDDRVVWHVVRGHDVSHHTIVGCDGGPMHMWDRYCHTCEVAW